MSSKPKSKWADLVSNIPDNYSGFERIRFSKPRSKPNWADLPFDIISIILPRLGTPAIIEVAQKVCSSWYNICKNPAMWKVIDTQNWGDLWKWRGSYVSHDLKKMCKCLVDRSQGQLEEINIDDFGGIGLLHYIADRSSKLKCLKLSGLSDIDPGELGEVLQKLPLLEELSLFHMDIYIEDIEVAGRYCPLLKTLKINREDYRMYTYQYEQIKFNQQPIAIARSFPKLLHLQLIGNRMNNIGLEAILDGCPHLESLDIRRCPNISLAGDLGLRCSQQIKYLRLPSDLIEDYKLNANVYRSCPSSWDSDDYDDLNNHVSYEFPKAVGKGVLGRCFRRVKVISYDDFPKVEDSDDLENFKFMFERSYKIKMKGKKEQFRKVLPKRKNKAIEKVVTKYCQKKEERKRGHFRKGQKTESCRVLRSSNKTSGLKLEARDSGLQTGDPAGFTHADTLACGAVGHIIGVGVVICLENIGAM